MNNKEILLEQFRACYDETNWFVTAVTALDGLTADEADWKAENTDNSIRGLVNHLSIWNERWLRRLNGETLEAAPENDGTFLAAADWETVRENFFRVMDSLEEILRDIGEEKLSQPVSADYAAPWSAPVANINIHNAYHIGQIVLIRKLQGSWDASKGVS